jgi:hypothetical protein
VDAGKDAKSTAGVVRKDSTETKKEDEPQLENFNENEEKK